MARREEMEQLRRYKFDAAFAEQIDLCGVGVISYKQNAIRLSKLMSEKPFSAEERLIRWTNFAVENGVLEELHVEGSRMNFITYFNLDVIAVAITVLCLFIFTVLKSLRIFCSRKRDTKLKRQ
ncbi:hypothetical protein TELCIR_05577 [Teladorsagia circumcincta]|uniref:glucuronosyltransferase n=1 Tax=Teladorsagia circumcincta TaxID=45464 RepID=A0A2G9UQG0_TELCI|nr:hypothetical protein TELCIR_05577 [Teladorsagia circumcincta]